jgi:NADH-quinone oxidoreductase subunit M
MGLLSVAIWLPIAFGVVLLALGRNETRALPAGRADRFRGQLPRHLPLITGFDTSTAAMQFVENLSWIERFNIHYHLGVDGISSGSCC